MGNIAERKGIMILGAGIMQVPLIRKANDMGLFVIASDKNPGAPGLKLAGHPLILDIKDIKGHVAFALANRERFNISGVVAGADCAVTAAFVSEALGLPGIPVDVAERSNNKWLMKQRWLRDNVATPWAEEVSSLTEARKALRKTGLPCMVKAIDNAASRGSRRIDFEHELEEALIDAKNHSTTKTALIEEYVEGVEQSVEMMVNDGVHHRFGIVDRHFGFMPFPIEVGHTNPSGLDLATQERIYRLVIGAAESLGIGFGPYKADTILTKKGPMVLELPARMSGGFHSQYTTPLATGLEPQKAAIALAVGMEAPEEAFTESRSGVTVCKAVFPEPGMVKAVSNIDRARMIRGVNEVFVLVRPGDVIPRYRNCADRVCYIIASGQCRAEAETIWRKAASMIKIETQPVLEEYETAL
ncbi:MAG: ATP-grasp domain-containing protein [Deltaproteobacteria bacterium]|nr:ATP-grasp domain-containing protein [Deltaproteobacteria bacterium]